MILVTGATGNVGRHVVEYLVAAGEKVRAVSRHADRAGLPAGVDVLPGDLRQPETLTAALRGVDRAFLFALPGQVAAFLAAAGESGLGRVVLLSSAAAASNAIGRLHAAYEQEVLQSGIPSSFVRPGAFMANDLRWIPGIKAEGVVRGPYGTAVSVPIDERDIAEVAARALVEDTHAGKAYQVTGPESLTAVERVRILGDALGRELRFAEQPDDQARKLMIEDGIPADIADSILTMSAASVGTAGTVSPAVREVTGRRPYSYADWAAHHVADFR